MCVLVCDGSTATVCCVCVDVCAGVCLYIWARKNVHLGHTYVVILHMVCPIVCVMHLFFSCFSLIDIFFMKTRKIDKMHCSWLYTANGISEFGDRKDGI